MVVKGNREKTAALRRRSKRRARAEVQGMSGLRSLSRTNTRDILTSPHREALTGQLPSDLGGRSSSPMLQTVSLVRPRHWLHPLHLFNREPQRFTLEEHVKVPIRIRLQRSSCEPRLLRSRLLVNKPSCKHKGYLTYGGNVGVNRRSARSARSLTV